MTSAIDGGLGDRLVLAELAVGDREIGKIDAVEDLALAGDRLRIVHGGRDQVIEIDVLDVEGFAHMGAARAQELRHSRLIRDTIKPGCNRLRRRRHLTERKRSGKHLDEDSFHDRAEARVKDSRLLGVNHRYKMAFCGAWFLPGAIIVAMIRAGCDTSATIARNRTRSVRTAHSLGIALKFFSAADPDYWGTPQKPPGRRTRAAGQPAALSFRLESRTLMLHSAAGNCAGSSASAAAAFAAASFSRSSRMRVSRLPATSRSAFIMAPVPAGISRPTITFSLRPSSVSTLPLTAASVSTRVVSWNDAAEMNERVCSDAFVMPSRTGWPIASLRPSSRARALTSSLSIFCSICRTITSMCLSLIETPCNR